MADTPLTPDEMLALPADPEKPRFYFDFRIDDQVTVDEVGLPFDDLEAAELNAAVTAAEIARGHLSKDASIEVGIEVRDEHRKPLSKVTATLRLERSTQGE